ncbi:MAG: anthranilate synthase component I family protein [Balneolaceae bacterium]
MNHFSANRLRTPGELIAALKQTHPGESCLLLESQLEGHPSSVQTFVAGKPVRECRVKDGAVTVTEHGTSRTFTGSPWHVLRDFHQAGKGWLFGFIGYEANHAAFGLNPSGEALYDAPDLYFFEPSLLARFSHGHVEWLRGSAPAPVPSAEPEAVTGPPKSLIEREHYLAAVRDIQQLIKEGAFYEMNYTYPMELVFEGSGWELYESMKRINPVPFGVYAQLGNLEICSASPERFLQKKGNWICSEPIKGTTARSADPAQDQQYKQELLNEKNRAENLMIVDLVRHDFSTVCAPGSVAVEALYDIQTFGTVHQMISRVVGQLQSGNDLFDALEAAFPMGSMTGAPKRRVMHQIDAMEPYRRGIYSGSFGYITPDGDADFNVVIRTAIVSGTSVFYNVGGAITGDSDPVDEWKETRIKARSITGWPAGKM